MLMAGNLSALSNHSIIDKLIEFWLPSEQNLLDNMVPIDIFS